VTVPGAAEALVLRILQRGNALTLVYGNAPAAVVASTPRRWLRVVHSALVVLAIVLAAACEPLPAWIPGDAPLPIWVPPDQGGVWLITLEGCDAWRATGLECVREERRSDAVVEVIMGDATGTAAADSTYAWQIDGHWEYEVTVDPNTMRAAASGNSAYARTVLAHEIGHLLGIWGHLEEGPALMTAGTSAPGPTALDFAALPFSYEAVP
jgi:hypothetical protein